MRGSRSLCEKGGLSSSVDEVLCFVFWVRVWMDSTVDDLGLRTERLFGSVIVIAFSPPGAVVFMVSVASCNEKE